MSKRSFIGIVLVTSVLVSTFGTARLLSYFQTAKRVLSRAVEENTPTSFHLERLKQMVDDLRPEFQRNRMKLASAEVDAAQLREDATKLQRDLTRMKERIVQRRNLLCNDAPYCIGGRQYTRLQVESDLKKRMNAYKSLEAKRTSVQKLLAAREKSAAALRKKLECYEEKCRRLEVATVEMESQICMLESQENTEADFDRDLLSKAEELSTFLQRRIKIAERVAKQSINDTEVVPSRPLRSIEVVHEIDKKFGVPRRVVHPNVGSETSWDLCD